MAWIWFFGVILTRFSAGRGTCRLVPILPAENVADLVNQRFLLLAFGSDTALGSSLNIRFYSFDS
jgi:hypothetical protein